MNHTHLQDSFAKQHQKSYNKQNSKNHNKTKVQTQDSNIPDNRVQNSRLQRESKNTTSHIIQQRDSTNPIQKPHKHLSSLKNSLEFDIVFKSQVKFHKDFMTIYSVSLHDFRAKLHTKKYYSRNIDSSILFGFSINKKVAKAHTRNLIKRRIKAILQKFVLQQEISHLVLLFVCRKSIVELNFHALENHIHSALPKILYSLQSHKKKRDFTK